MILLPPFSFSSLTHSKMEYDQAKAESLGTDMPPATSGRSICHCHNVCHSTASVNKSVSSSLPRHRPLTASSPRDDSMYSSARQIPLCHSLWCEPIARHCSCAPYQRPSKFNSYLLLSAFVILGICAAPIQLVIASSPSSPSSVTSIVNNSTSFDYYLKLVHQIRSPSNDTSSPSPSAFQSAPFSGVPSAHVSSINNVTENITSAKLKRSNDGEGVTVEDVPQSNDDEEDEEEEEEEEENEPTNRGKNQRHNKADGQRGRGNGQSNDNVD